MVGSVGSFTILKAVERLFSLFSAAFPAWQGQISNKKTWHKSYRNSQQWGFFPHGPSSAYGSAVCVSEWYRHTLYAPYI